VLELHAHGGPVLLDRLVARIVELGARPARPGEFSERAFLNGKSDLASAEAVADLIEAGTAAAARAAVRSMQGEFSARIRDLERALIELRTQLEAAIDFVEEDLDLPGRDAVDARIEALLADFERIERAARQGMLLREGITVVIAGAPNAGKSTLLNRLAGEDIAIVTASPGTTRDLLRVRIDIEGLPVELIDTAGLRRASDEAEIEGIRRARRMLEQADLILWVVDAAEATTGRSAHAEPIPGSLLQEDLGIDLPWPAQTPLIEVRNKVDLLEHATAATCAHRDATEGRTPPDAVRVSALTGEGLEELRHALAARVGYFPAEHALAARRRHLDALRRAREAVKRSAPALAAGIELAAEELRLAQRALGEVTGEFTSEDLLAEIFASFCIGK
jgi:tRNA modification GTPase